MPFPAGHFLWQEVWQAGRCGVFPGVSRFWRGSGAGLLGAMGSTPALQCGDAAARDAAPVPLGSG